ncbi:MAG: hypothetical protein ABIO39_00315 [Caulobacteraceae bacterium]
MNQGYPSRRGLLAGAGAATAAWPLLSHAQGAPAPGAPAPGGPPARPPAPPPTPADVAAALPLKTTGIEHVSMLVPDVAAAGLFYGRVFSPFLRKEKAPPLRYYVPLKVGYIAIGAAGQRPTQIDHFCTLVEDYKPSAVIERLKAEGAGAGGRFGMIPDADGLQLQLLAVPGGWAASIEDAGAITEDKAIVTPLSLENVILQVSDFDHAIAYYQKLYPGKLTKVGADRAWIQIASTRLGIAKVPAGGKPAISSFCVNVARFDRKDVSKKLQAIGAEIIETSGTDKDVLRFKSPIGLTVDLRGTAA